MPAIQFPFTQSIVSTNNAAMTTLAQTPFQPIQVHQATSEIETNASQFTPLSKQQISDAISHDGLARIFDQAGQSDRAQHIRQKRGLPVNAPKTHEKPEPESNCQISVTVVKKHFTIRAGGVSCEWETPLLTVSMSKSFNLRKGSGRGRASIAIPRAATGVHCHAWYVFGSKKAYPVDVPLTRSDLKDCGVINFESFSTWGERKVNKLDHQLMTE